MINITDAMVNPNYRIYLSNSKLTSGVMIAYVENNSSADKGGLEIGDIITEINGNKISNVAYLRYELYKYNIGDTIKITIERDGKEKEISLKLSSKLQTS